MHSLFLSFFSSWSIVYKGDERHPSSLITLYSMSRFTFLPLCLPASPLSSSTHRSILRPQRVNGERVLSHEEKWPSDDRYHRWICSLIFKSLVMLIIRIWFKEKSCLNWTLSSSPPSPRRKQYWTLVHLTQGRDRNLITITADQFVCIVRDMPMFSLFVNIQRIRHHHRTWEIMSCWSPLFTTVCPSACLSMEV